MKTFSFTINGQAVSSPESFPVINPATETEITQCPNATAQHVNDAVNAASQAFQSWKQLTESERAHYLKKAANAIEQHKDKLAHLLSQEQGKPLAKAMDEIDAATRRLQSSLNVSLPVEVIFEADETRTELHHKPLGVVAVITPWNYPVSIAVGRTASALMAGNTVVIKPSPYTPLSTLLFGDIIRDIFPAGAVNVIAGGDEAGKQLTQNPLVRKISFTGSVSAGKAIAGVAAHDLKRITLELGGNDPAIVLDDANVDAIAENIFWGAFGNSGQICIAIKRLYVHESLFDALVNKLKNIAENVTLGEGLDPSTQLGPLNNKMQFDIICDLVEDAKQNGATIVTGGSSLDQAGYFYKPTLVTNIKEGVRLVDEEQFGPALPIIKFSDIEDAIRRANSTSMGLGASVWGSDLKRAHQVAERLESGVAWVNSIGDLDPRAPFGGVKHSGIGRVFGHWGLEELTEKQTISINKK